jgi:hypothetical protein
MEGSTSIFRPVMPMTAPTGRATMNLLKAFNSFKDALSGTENAA